MIINKKWEMPNKNTFDIKVIKKLIGKYHNSDLISIDPFANTNRIASITNDLDPEVGADFCMDALDFLKTFADNSVDFVFYDPPYSPRQVAECYKKMGKTVNMETTQATFWTKLKQEVTRIVKKDGVVISFGWNSGGIGKKNGFECLEILLVAHGGIHNDTIVTVEKKL